MFLMGEMAHNMYKCPGYFRTNGQRSCHRDLHHVRLHRDHVHPAVLREVRVVRPAVQKQHCKLGAWLVVVNCWRSSWNKVDPTSAVLLRGRNK